MWCWPMITSTGRCCGSGANGADRLGPNCRSPASLPGSKILPRWSTHCWRRLPRGPGCWWSATSPLPRRSSCPSPRSVAGSRSGESRSASTGRTPPPPSRSRSTGWGATFIAPVCTSGSPLRWGRASSTPIRGGRANCSRRWSPGGTACRAGLRRGSILSTGWGRVTRRVSSRFPPPSASCRGWWHPRRPTGAVPLQGWQSSPTTPMPWRATPACGWSS